VFVTNAVKHFQYEQRGKRRLHKRPDAGEIDACRWWLDLERSLVRPRSCWGATAVRGVFGRVMTITTARDTVHMLPDGTKARVTIHPSSLLLRLRDEADKVAQTSGLLLICVPPQRWRALPPAASRRSGYGSPIYL
jgi:DNA polymerase